MIKDPSIKTLDKYGMILSDFRELVEKQGGACAICLKVPSSGRLNIDHVHLKGWAKLPPHERHATVRGLLCYICNYRLLTKGVSIDRLLSAAEYLQRHEHRKGLAGPNDWMPS